MRKTGEKTVLSLYLSEAGLARDQANNYHLNVRELILSSLKTKRILFLNEPANA